MSKNDVNIGLSPNDNTGDPLRVSFEKLNNTLTELYQGLGDGDTLNLTLNSEANIEVTGKVTSQATETGDDDAILTTKGYVDSQFGTADTLPEVLSRGNTTGGSDIAVSADDNITFTDSSEATFGTGADLKIFHNGTDAKITNAEGDLKISGGNVEISGGNLTAPYFLGDLNGTINTLTTGVTQLPAVNNTTIATTAFANAAVAASAASYLPLAGGTLTGNLIGTGAAFTGKLAIGNGVVPASGNLFVTSGTSTSFELNRSGANAGQLIFENGNVYNGIYSKGALSSARDLRFYVGNVIPMTLTNTALNLTVPISGTTASFSTVSSGGTLSFGSLKDTAEDITITKFVDEADGLANNDNDTTIPTSAAVVDYVTATPGVMNYKAIGLAMDYMSRVHDDGGTVEGMEQVMINTEKLILS